MSLPRLMIEYPDGRTEDVQVRPSDVVRFEAHFKIPYVSAWVDAQMALARVEEPGDDATAEQVQVFAEQLVRVDAAISTSHLYFLAWSASTKGSGVPFEEWLDTIVGAEYWRAGADDASPLDQGGSIPTPPDTPLSLSTSVV